MKNDQSGFLLFQLLIALPILISLLGLGMYLVTFCEKTLHLLQAYVSVHDHARMAQMLLRHELATKNTLLILKEGVEVSDSQNEKLFFISKTTRKNHQGKPIFSLYEKINDHPANELFEGIEKMEMVFDSEHAHVIHLFLLFVSNEDVLTKPCVYTFLNRPLKAEDKRLYLPLHLVIASS